MCKHIPAFQKIKINEVELQFDFYLAVSFHSISSPSLTSSSISEKSGCDSCASSPTSSPRINCTLWAGGVTKQLCNRAHESPILMSHSETNICESMYIQRGYKFIRIYIRSTIRYNREKFI